MFNLAIGLGFENRYHVWLFTRRIGEDGKIWGD